MNYFIFSLKDNIMKMAYKVKFIKIDKYQDLFDLGDNIINKIIPKSFCNFRWKKCTNEHENILNSIEFINSNKDICHLLKDSSNILKENGFAIDKNNYHIDFHRYFLSNDDSKFKTDLDWHKDDKGATGYNVNTIIYYLNKDTTLEGGNLLYKRNKKDYKISVESNLIILMDGRLIHKPEDICGYGRRDSIVIQFKRP